jgi:hypothetical protein
MSLSTGISLKTFTMEGQTDGYQLLIRVVNVDFNDKLTLPVREIWAKRDLESYDYEIQYILYSADSAYEVTQEVITYEQVNGYLGGQDPWLRTLYHQSRIGHGYAPWWFPTRVVRAEEEEIWKFRKNLKMMGTSYFEIDEINLGTWLELREKGEGTSADEYDDEAEWISHEAAGEESGGKREGEDMIMDDGGDVEHDSKEGRGVKRSRAKKSNRAKERGQVKKRGQAKKRSQAKNVDKKSLNKGQDEVMEDVDAMPNNNSKSGKAVVSGPSVNGQFSMTLRSHRDVVIDEGYEAGREYGVTRMPIRGGRVP